LFKALNSSCWDALQLRIFSVLIFSVLMKFELKRNSILIFLQSLNLLSFKNCEIHFKKLMSGDFSSVYKHGRGGKRNHGIYDFYPELEDSARAFAWTETSKKASNFTVKSLALFITSEYKNLSGDKNLNQDVLVRSISSCREDLIRWGCTNGENKQMTYAKRHEDPEVVEYRKKFIEEMKMKKDLYYTVCLDDENIDKNKYLNIEKKQYGGVELKWKIPIRKEGAGSHFNEP